MRKKKKKRVSVSAGEEVEDYHFDLLLLLRCRKHTDESGNKQKNSGIAASNILFHSWSLIFRFYHSGFEWTFYLPLYFISFIKIAVGWKFLSHFRRPDQVKCKNHLKFRNIGLTVEQMSDSLLVFSLDFLLCLFWKHTSNLEDWPDVCFPNWNTHEQRNHFPHARFNVTNGFHDSFVCF